MAKKKELSRYQQGIVRRYYENREQLSTQKLAELVTELYLCTTDKKADQLWKRAHTALLQTEADKGWLEKVVANRDIEGLAKIVKDLF